jgi:hypothetical protein
LASDFCLGVSTAGVAKAVQTTDADDNARSTSDFVKYGYDDLNRLESEVWVNGGKSFIYAYDRNGNRISARECHQLTI